MMKKFLTTLLAAVMLLSVVSCAKDDNTDNSVASTKYEGTLTELVADIYEKCPVDCGPEAAMPIDLTNADNLRFYLGLSDANGIEEAVFSEPMIGAIPYSLCLVRVAEGADASALVESIRSSVNTRKWVCVEANNLVVENCKDVIIMVMTNPEYGATLSQDLAQAFGEIVTGVDSAEP